MVSTWTLSYSFRKWKDMRSGNIRPMFNALQHCTRPIQKQEIMEKERPECNGMILLANSKRISVRFVCLSFAAFLVCSNQHLLSDWSKALAHTHPTYIHSCVEHVSYAFSTRVLVAHTCYPNPDSQPSAGHSTVFVQSNTQHLTGLIGCEQHPTVHRRPKGETKHTETTSSAFIQLFVS